MDEALDDLGRLCSLDDPKRRALYRYVVAQAEPVTRDEASEALGIDRSTVAYHLDRLVDEGLLAPSFARPEGRGGPGAGRPAKHYERAGVEIAISVPPRNYRLLAELLARAIEDEPDGPVLDALAAAARAHGAALAGGEQASGDLRDALARQGFEPYDDGGVIRLRNCPFDRLAQEHTELVCGMNLALMTGLAEAVGAGLDPALDPAPNRCCIAFRR